MKKKFFAAIMSFVLIILLLCCTDSLVAASSPTTTSEANIPSENNTLSTSYKDIHLQTALLVNPVIVEEIKKENAAAALEEAQPEPEPIPQRVPQVSHDFKSYTAYTCLSRRSPQWTKIQTIAYSDENGLRKVENYYCVAMGSYYSTTLGDLFRITTEDGYVFEVILCDFKANRHTNSTHQYTARNECITEFYVDYSCFNSAARRAGSVSVIPGFSGKITSIEYLGNYFVD